MFVINLNGGMIADLSIVDECDVTSDRESINKSYILLTNSKDVDEATTGAILNVSNAYQMSQVNDFMTFGLICNLNFLV